METKTTLNAYTLIGMAGRAKVADLIGVSVPTLRQKLNGSIAWTINEAETLDIEIRECKTMQKINATVKSLKSNHNG